MNPKSRHTASVSYQSAVGIAIVAAVFMVIIGGLLTNSAYHRVVTEPTQSAELEKMKEQAKANPSDTVLADLILELDTQIRRDQFARLYFLRRGTFLFVVTLILLVGSILWAVSHHPKRPELQPQGDLKIQQVRQAGLIRTAFSVAVILLCSGALFWVLHAPHTEIELNEQAISLYTPMEQVQNQWPTFRGPGGQGICWFENIPDTWDGKTGENILWTTPVPLEGHNSPIVWDNHIFLTGATKDKQQVFCFDAQTGQLLWTQDVSIPQTPAHQEMDLMEETGYAACTAVTDGKRVCAIFAGGDIGCFTVDGDPLWEKHLGVPESAYGYAASLTASEENVIVQWDVSYEEDQSKLIALNWLTGNITWQTTRPVPNSWSSPTVTTIADAYRIVTAASPYVIVYDARTGAEISRVECISGDIASTPIVADNKILAVEPYNKLVAVDAAPAPGAAAAVLWEAEEEMPDICSPVSNGTLVWTLTTQGNLSCFDLGDGTLVYTQSIKLNFQASPTLVNDRLYLLAENGTMLIVAAGREYSELKRNQLTQRCYASPAFAPGRIYIRANEDLLAIGTAP